MIREFGGAQVCFLAVLVSRLCSTESSTLFQHFNFIWKSTAPSNVKVFCWMLALGKINMHEMLQKRIPTHAFSPDCRFRKRSSVTRDQCFLHCYFVGSIWSRVLQEFGLSWVWPENCKELLQHVFGSSGYCSRKNKLWNVAVFAIFWSLWLERNNRIFEDIKNNFETLWDKIKYRVYLTFLNPKVSQIYPLLIWLGIEIYGCHWGLVFMVAIGTWFSSLLFFLCYWL